MTIYGFLRENARWLTAGGVLTLSASFGQTFFISIFAGEIRSTFDLSHAAWGGIYTLGTLASALVMLFAGGLTDRVRVRRLSGLVLLGLAVACLALSAAPAYWALPIAIFGLRFCGQGMLSHIAVVAVGRWFARNRGRANAIISIGFVVGEAVFPILFVLLMGFVGWRISWVFAAGLTLLFIPVLLVLLRTERQPASSPTGELATGMDGKHWTRSDALSHWFFWAVAAGLVAPPIFGTAFFFQQVHLTEIKGWSLTSYVALMPLYTGGTLLSVFASGWIVDRFGTSRLVPFTMLPSALTFVLVSQGGSLYFAAVGFVLFGLTHGALVAIAGSFWPEYYGTRHLGSVRAVATSLMVFGSAIGPGLTGVLIDAGVDFRHQLIGMAIYYVLVSILLAAAFARVRHRVSIGT